MPIKAFAGSLAAQLINKTGILEEDDRLKKKRYQEEVVELLDDFTLIIATLMVDEEDEDGIGYVTYVTLTGRKILQCTHQCYGMEDTLARFPVGMTDIKKRARVQSCCKCGKIIIHM